ncbi:MAG: hypothetical protein ACF8QF_13110 [Phycisphaerales bacterium]
MSAPKFDGEDIAHARAWLELARDPAALEALDAIYDETSARIRERGPACWASGRCCNFERTGHLLYVTGLEAAATMTRAARARSSPLALAPATPGACPFQEGNLCAVHTVRPLGCRVYFCDRAAQDWQRSLTEAMQEQVRALHDRLGAPYRYAEWRWLLALVRDAGATSC